MNLTEAQKQTIQGWISEGLRLAEIQRRLESELRLSMTYMEARLLLDDLKLVPKDQPPPAPASQIGGTAATPAQSRHPSDSEARMQPSPPSTLPPEGQAGGVRVEVDRVTKPGTLVSGSVSFSDGQSASWYLDQLGRLGLAPKTQGYRPSPQDLEEFQIEVQNELQRMGL